MHINIRSLRKNFNTLQILLTELNVEFDIIVLTETWLNNNDNLDLYSLKGYHHEFNHRKFKKRGGGIGFYVRNNLRYKICEKFSISEERFMESFGLEININKNSIFRIIGIYKAPFVKIKEFNENFETFLNNVGSTKTYILGDFNIDLLSNKDNLVQDFINIMHMHSFSPIINKPTRITKTTATLIDNIWINSKSNNLYNGIILNDTTDHFPIFLTERHTKVQYRHETKYTTKRQLKDHNITSLKNDLSILKWHNVLKCQNPEEAFNIFDETFLKYLNKNCPIKLCKISTSNNDKKWITNKLKNACRKKHSLYKEYLKNPNNITRVKYNTYRNKVKHFITKTEGQYYSTKLTRSNDINQTWKIIKNILKPNNNLKVTQSLTDDGHVITEPSQISKKFNEHFTTIGENLANKLPKKIPPFTNFLQNKILSSIYLRPTNKTELLEIVSNFKNKLSNDNDELNMKTIKTIFPTIVVPIEHLINISLTNGFFPTKLKQAKVLPFFKKGEKTDLNNYRPISILPQISKIFEKVYYNRLISFLDKNNIVTQSQYGFRKNSKTSYGIINMVENIHSALTTNKIPIGIFIDLQKAFDTIDHSILLEKLNHYGIRGPALKWLGSYLSNRNQYVLYNNCKSNLIYIRYGVPQGSILGPILFLIYINDIIYTSEKLSFVLFADDTNVFYVDDNLNNLSNNLKIELDKLRIWFLANKLSINISKTNYIIFGPKSNSELTILIGNEPIKKVESTKFLGVFIDQYLNWSQQINSVVCNITRNLNTINKIKHKLNKKALLHIYHSFIESHLSYCIEIWGNAPNNKLKKLETLQKQAIRLLEKLPHRTSTSYFFKTNNLLKFKDLIHSKLCCLGYMAHKNSLPSKLQTYFDMSLCQHPYPTRTNTHFRTNKFINKYSNTSVIEKTKRLFNNLPNETKMTPTIISFKKVLKQSCISSY
jgi:hypothetical protein